MYIVLQTIYKIVSSVENSILESLYVIVLYMKEMLNHNIALITEKQYCHNAEYVLLLIFNIDNMNVRKITFSCCL